MQTNICDENRLGVGGSSASMVDFRKLSTNKETRDSIESGIVVDHL